MRLLFVYNAEAGLMNGIMDSVHKLVSPSTYACDLCAITYGVFAMNGQWRRWLKALPIETKFYHRADFKEEWPAADVRLPVVLVERDGALATIIAADEFTSLRSVNDLVAMLEARLDLPVPAAALS